MGGSDLLRNARRIVVKVGSSLVTNDGRGLDETAIGEWCRQLTTLALGGREVIMVSSGAIAEGTRRLGLAPRPQEMRELQAAAAVGQIYLAQAFAGRLQEHGMRSAQLLLTHDDFADRQRYLNARSTLLTLLELRVLPVINENDTVVTDPIRFGDNDTLAALVANLVEADLLVILTDQKGLYSADPRRDPMARIITKARAGDAALEQMAGGSGSSIGKGGMITKVRAARRACASGASTVIASGREPDCLLRLGAGEAVGTLLVSQTQRSQARKRWMSDHLQLRGAVTVDDGAAIKLLAEGKSLLPIGMTATEGDFHRGDVIAVRNRAGQEVARGLANYSAAEARLLCGRPSGDIEKLLGYVAAPEMIHRTNLILMR